MDEASTSVDPEAGEGKWAAEGKGTAAPTFVGVNKWQKDFWGSTK